MSTPEGVFVHALALNESSTVGAGTRIWAWAHVLAGAVVGKDCNVGDHAFIEGGAVVGDGVTIKNGVAIWDGVTLEPFVFVGPNVAFTNDRFPRSPRHPDLRTRYADKGWLERTLVREGASLGANCSIVCGVTIGRYALVAAGAVVTADVPDFRIVAGSPARVVGSVCLCGDKLARSGDLRCTRCGRAYVITGPGLALTDD